MKRISYIIMSTFALLVSAKVSAQELQFGADAEVRQGQTATMNIVMNNSEAVRGFQFDMSLPEGLTPVVAKVGDTDHDLTVSKVGDSKWRVLSYSFDNTEYPTAFGAVASVSIAVPEGYATGDYTVALSNAYLSNADNVKVSSADYAATLTVYSVHTLSYIVDGVSVYSEEVRTGTALTPISAPTKEGYTFSGWSEVPATMPANDVTITGTFSVNSYTLTYIVDGETYKTEAVAYGTAITAIDEPTKEGYTFSGWSEMPATMQANDVTITGTFAVNSYTLTYIVDGETYKTEAVAYGTAITVIDEPTKEGYTFSGWSEMPVTMPANDVTVTGSFSVNSYTLTYIVDNETYKTEAVAYGTAITAIDEPTKEGYTFSGWSEVPATMPANDMTVTGSFTVNNYTITYIVDGEVFKTETVTYGSALTPIASPTKEGHTFSGWSEMPATMQANDVTITGTFTVNSYMLTYMVDGETYKTETIAYGTTITAIDEPAKEGYTFSGWSETPVTMPANDVTVTGSFSVNSYTLTYIVDNETYKTEAVAYGTAITVIDEPTKEGYTFSGWSEMPVTMPANDVTVTGSFTVNNYTITYIVDGEVFKTETVTYGSALTPIASPTKEGHTFSGWSEMPETMTAEDVTITGTFTVNSYMLTYMVDGETYKTETIAYGTTITAIDEPTKEGYTFSGWSEVPATMPANDMTVTGSFTVNNYTITYIVDGEVFKTETVTYGSALTPIASPTKEGHTFSGWSEMPETMTAEDVTITGTFTVNSYMLTYMVDGETYKTETIAYGTTITAIAEPAKEGHTFSGWSEMPVTMPANDVTITGKFSVNSYMVRYYDGETLLAEYEVEFGSAIPTYSYDNEEFVFERWEGEMHDTMPAHDIAYYAITTPNRIANAQIDDNTEITVYDLTGLAVYKGKKAGMPKHLKGLYVIKFGDKSIKRKL